MSTAATATLSAGQLIIASLPATIALAGVIGTTWWATVRESVRRRDEAVLTARKLVYEEMAQTVLTCADSLHGVLQCWSDPADWRMAVAQASIASDALAKTRALRGRVAVWASAPVAEEYRSIVLFLRAGGMDDDDIIASVARLTGPTEDLGLSTTEVNALRLTEEQLTRCGERLVAAIRAELGTGGPAVTGRTVEPHAREVHAKGTLRTARRRPGAL